MVELSRKIKVLAVDDNSEALSALADVLSDNGYEVVTAGSGHETLQVVAAELPDIILLDVQMPGPDGLQVTRLLKADERFRYIPILLLTGKDSLEDIIHGLEIGADDYIRKPYSVHELLARLKAALRTRELYQSLQSALDEAVSLRKELQVTAGYERIIGQSDEMKAVFRVLDKVKDSAVSVLITGESGTGKELIAQAIHYSSNRKDKTFVAQNVSALQDTLLESELFGHVRGAFTGAVRDKQGLFAVADGGTLFLDELGEMSPAMQAKLLRVLQDGTFVPVGDTKPKKVDVRVIGATHRRLDDMIQRGEFREDLYYRLNVIQIELPPLRNRFADIPLLLQKFLQDFAKKYGGTTKSVSREVLACLQSYRWPGNIRQLQNEVERMCLLSSAESIITAEHVSSAVLGTTAAPIAPALVLANDSREVKIENLKTAVERLERSMIEAAMKAHDNNKSEVAKVLGISRSSLIQKVQSYEK